MSTTTTKSTTPRWRRKRWIVAMILAALAIPSAAFGAWLIYNSSASGTATATYTATGPANGGDVVTFTPAASPAISPGGAATDLVVSAVNRSSPQVPEQITTWSTPTITAVPVSGHPTSCANFVHWSPPASTVTVPVGTTTLTLSGVVTTDNFAPSYCTGDVVTFAFPTGGVTSP